MQIFLHLVVGIFRKFDVFISRGDVMKFMVISSLVFGLLYAWPISTFSLDEYQKDTITVYVQGEVVEEKKVVLDKYSTVEDALGFIELTDEADISGFNLLICLKDQDVLSIPKKTTIAKISINTATVDELMNIPGIGKVKAEKIISYRELNGLFQTIEDIMKIDGIKEKSFEKLKDFICL